MNDSLPRSSRLCDLSYGMETVLRIRQVIPPLTARTAEGKAVRAWDYKQKRPLVIVFLHAGCSNCESWLGQFAVRAADLADREAVVLVIYAELPPRINETLPPPLISAADTTGRSQRAFLGRQAFGPSGLDRVGVFVTDRYGELFEQWVAKDAGELPIPGEILGILHVIQIIC
jgi:hypothetical protein